jgi:hypothetical protein
VRSGAIDSAKTTAKIVRARDKIRKDRLKSLRDHKADAQAAVNAYVRARDDGLPCISCGRDHRGAWHAGHYLTRQAHPELALDPTNIHRQCAPCNLYLSGNQINFRLGLIARYGVEYVERLESHHPLKKLNAEELKAIRAEYQQKRRDLINQRTQSCTST